jgi:hypothetical protein
MHHAPGGHVRPTVPPPVLSGVATKLEIIGKKLVFVKNYITYDNNFIFYK